MSCGDRALAHSPVLRVQREQWPETRFDGTDSPGHNGLQLPELMFGCAAFAPTCSPVTAQTTVLIPVQVLSRRRAKSAETAANTHDWIYSDPHSVATALVVRSRGKSVSER